ncbi:MAG: DUF4350 domain-containing protein [Armatimonadota bacterium]|nr:DUF4350 domain-containing protein [Armatimonadota bacterium]
MVTARFVGTVAVLTAAAVTVVLWVLPSPTDYAPSNPRWNGLRSIAREYGATGVVSFDALPSGANTVLVVIPSRPPTAAEVTRLRGFLAAGGTLVLMDDFGAGNAVLEGLAVAARFSGHPLADGLFNHRNPRLPRIVDIAPGAVTAGVKQLVLNHATTISPPGDLQAVAWSSAVSYLDTNDSGRREAGEPVGPFPVVATGRAGGGTLVLVADSSVLLNAMLPLGDNRRFAANLFALGGARSKVLLDEAHLPHGRLDAAKIRLRAGRAIVSRPLPAFILTAVALAVPLMSLLTPTRR